MALSKISLIVESDDGTVIRYDWTQIRTNHPDSGASISTYKGELRKVYLCFQGKQMKTENTSAANGCRQPKGEH